MKKLIMAVLGLVCALAASLALFACGDGGNGTDEAVVRDVVVTVEADDGEKSGFVVTLGGENKTTGADGTVRFEDVEEGWYIVTAEQEGYVTVETSVAKSAFAAEADVTVTLAPEKIVVPPVVVKRDVVVTVEADDGEKSGFVVTLGGENKTTGADGTVRFSAVEENDYTITVERDGYEVTTVQIAKSEFAEEVVRVTAEPVKIVHYSDIAVTVNDPFGENGGFTVGIEGQSQQTDEGGLARLTHVEGGDCEVTVSKEGYETLKLFIPEEAFESEEIVLEADAMLALRDLGTVGGSTIAITYSIQASRTAHGLFFRITADALVETDNERVDVYISVGEQLQTARSLNTYDLAVRGGLVTQLSNYPDGTNAVALPVAVERSVVYTEGSTVNDILIPYMAFGLAGGLGLDLYDVIGLTFTCYEANSGVTEVLNLKNVPGIEGTTDVSRFNPSAYLRLDPWNTLGNGDRNIVKATLSGTTDEGVTVTVNGVSTVSEAGSGSYTLEFNKTGKSATVQFSKFGYITAEETVSFTASKEYTCTHTDLALDETLTGYTLKGTLKNMYEEGIEGATVKLMRGKEAVQTATAGGDGSFEFSEKVDLVDLNGLIVTAEKEGYETFTRSATVDLFTVESEQKTCSLGISLDFAKAKLGTNIDEKSNTTTIWLRRLKAGIELTIDSPKTYPSDELGGFMMLWLHTGKTETTGRNANSAYLRFYENGEIEFYQQKKAANGWDVLAQNAAKITGGWTAKEEGAGSVGVFLLPWEIIRVYLENGKEADRAVTADEVIGFTYSYNSKDGGDHNTYLQEINGGSNSTSNSSLFLRLGKYNNIFVNTKNEELGG